MAWRSLLTLTNRQQDNEASNLDGGIGAGILLIGERVHKVRKEILKRPGFHKTSR